MHRSQLPRKYIEYLTRRKELIRKKLPCSAAQRNPPGPKTGEQMGEETRAIVAKMEELLNDAEEQRRCIGALMNLKDKPSDTLSPGPAMPMIEAGAVKATIKAMEKASPQCGRTKRRVSYAVHVLQQPRRRQSKSSHR